MYRVGMIGCGGISGVHAEVLSQMDNAALTACAADEKIGHAYWGAGHKRCIEDFYRCLPHPEAYKNSAASCENTMRTLLKVYEQNPAAL